MPFEPEVGPVCVLEAQGPGVINLQSQCEMLPQCRSPNEPAVARRRYDENHFILLTGRCLSSQQPAWASRMGDVHDGSPA